MLLRQQEYEHRMAHHSGEHYGQFSFTFDREHRSRGPRNYFVRGTFGSNNEILIEIAQAVLGITLSLSLSLESLTLCLYLSRLT